MRTWPRLVADGGCRTLHAASPDWLPELVLGDLDSAPAELLEWYRERWAPSSWSWAARGVEVRDLSSDQDTTDLEKSLMAAQQVGRRDEQNPRLRTSPASGSLWRVASQAFRVALTTPSGR